MEWRSRVFPRLCSPQQKLSKDSNWQWVCLYSFPLLSSSTKKASDNTTAVDLQPWERPFWKTHSFCYCFLGFPPPFLSLLSPRASLRCSSCLWLVSSAPRQWTADCYVSCLFALVPAAAHLCGGERRLSCMKVWSSRTEVSTLRPIHRESHSQLCSQTRAAGGPLTGSEAKSSLLRGAT